MLILFYCIDADNFPYSYAGVVVADLVSKEEIMVPKFCFYRCLHKITCWFKLCNNIISCYYY